MKKAMQEWAEEIYRTAKAHGWHDGERPTAGRAEGASAAKQDAPETRAFPEKGAGRYAERGADAYMILMASELGEATEELRAGRPMVYGDDIEEERRVEDMEAIRSLRLKPEGMAVELIDCVIRILDYAMATWGEEGPHSDPEEWEDFATVIIAMDGRALCDVGPEELIAKAHWHVSKAWEYTDRGGCLRAYSLMDCTSLILSWLEAHGVDAEAVLALKHEYNKTRPYRHGGKLL